jgi:lipoate-protein ligase A
MSSEVETSLENSDSRRIQRFLDSARNDKPEQTTPRLFANLMVHHDKSAHAAAMNMAVDETLLRMAVVPTIRFYRWRSPALSFGYFGKFSDVAIYAEERDLVRRWTGGGIVFHGEDLTYTIVIPANDPTFDESSIVIYDQIHGALAEALNGAGERAVVAGDVDPDGIALARTAGVNAAGYNCFANPVRADVMINNRKIAGAAQRRTRSGLLQQGSIQGITVNINLAGKFAQSLSASRSEVAISDEVFQRARELAQQKYGTESWLRKR